MSYSWTGGPTEDGTDGSLVFRFVRSSPGVRGYTVILERAPVGISIYVARLLEEPRVPFDELDLPEPSRHSTVEPDGIAPQDGPACVVCMTEYEVDELVQNLNCGHNFHHSCIKQWVDGARQTCPICRQDVSQTTTTTTTTEEVVRTLVSN